MATAIKLYQRAYDLDYRKGDWEYAEELYNEIIKRFPYSEEKEYAQVHLDRIAKLKANPLDQALQPVRAKGASGALISFCFLLILLLMVATGFSGYFLWQQKLRQDYNELLLQGIMSEKTGNIKDAAQRYKYAQKILPENNLAHRFLAELYLNQKKFELAEIEYKQWELATPYDNNLKGFKIRLNNIKNQQGQIND